MEDRISTGSSVRAFIRALREQGFDVKGVVALKGDPFIEPEPRAINFLEEQLERKGLPFKAEQVAEKLTQREAAALAIHLKNLEMIDDVQRRELAGRIHGLLDQGAP